MISNGSNESEINYVSILAKLSETSNHKTEFLII